MRSVGSAPTLSKYDYRSLPKSLASLAISYLSIRDLPPSGFHRPTAIYSNDIVNLGVHHLRNLSYETDYVYNCCGGLRPHIGASGINPQDCSYLAVSPFP
ncbi:hypothetical protein VN97_g6737 [Penicillium thymicola]|uniref:Uncharacterized protein n=1 Tax=Penicillium thymicola TaxID=293382 RepID=A0AAI9THL2_PENTH|nr:hypothetical protein VN97_g6737 [Penicillium thymicola]